MTNTLKGFSITCSEFSKIHLRLYKTLPDLFKTRLSLFITFLELLKTLEDSARFHKDTPDILSDFLEDSFRGFKTFQD